VREGLILRRRYFTDCDSDRVEGFVAWGAATMPVAGGLLLGIRLRFHNHAPQQLANVLALHQHAADELGGDHLGGAGEEGAGEVLGGRGGYGSSYRMIDKKQNHKLMLLRTPTALRALLLLVGIPLLTCISLTGKAQTLRKPIPACHLLPAYTPGSTECFDDVDRNGKFSYDRGDRAFTLKSWREYQLNSTY